MLRNILRYPYLYSNNLYQTKRLFNTFKLIKDISHKDKEKQQRYLNRHNENKYSNIKPRDYMLLPFYKTYLKENKKKLDLENYVRMQKYIYNDKPDDINNYRLEMAYDITNINVDDISMSNILMFGKKRVLLEHLEVLLCFIRFKRDINNNRYYLDNYCIDFNNLYMDYADYKITFHTNKDHFDELEFCKITKDKMNAARIMIYLMNEIPPNLLNHHNYEVLFQYYCKYEMIAERIADVLNQ